MSEPTFLKLRDGYINPAAIRWVEAHDGFLVLSVEGKEQPIAAREGDADTIRAYCDSRRWVIPQAEDTP